MLFAPKTPLIHLKFKPLSSKNWGEQSKCAFFKGTSLESQVMLTYKNQQRSGQRSSLIFVVFSVYKTVLGTVAHSITLMTYYVEINVQLSKSVTELFKWCIKK